MQCFGECFLDHPLILGFYILGILALSLLLVHADLAANFGFWSSYENLGLYAQLGLVSAYIIILAWVMVFFHTYRRKHYRQERLFFINLWLCVVYVVGIMSPYFMLRHPTKNEILNYIQHSPFGNKGQLMNSFQKLQEEKHCCGVNGYMDYCLGKTPSECGIHYFPVSCCKKRQLLREVCQVAVSNNTEVSLRLNTKGCIPTGLSDFKHTKTYATVRLVKGCALIPLFFPLVTIIVIQAIIVFTKPRDASESFSSDLKSKKSRGTELRVMFPFSSRSRAGKRRTQNQGDENNSGPGIIPMESSLASINTYKNSQDSTESLTAQDPSLPSPPPEPENKTKKISEGQEDAKKGAWKWLSGKER